jgi:hypothetical protein
MSRIEGEIDRRREWGLVGRWEMGIWKQHWGIRSQEVRSQDDKAQWLNR